MLQDETHVNGSSRVGGVIGSAHTGNLHTPVKRPSHYKSLTVKAKPAPSKSTTHSFLAMLTKRAILASLAVHALSSLASPVDRLLFQDPAEYLVSNGMCLNTQPEEQLAEPPEVHLDDGVFTGIAKGATHQFLGIPFAYPP